jgi:ethanolamine utilization microcompartment shell protein EutS
VHGQLLTYQSRIPVYYVHGPYGVMYYYCNIQECVTGKSVTVHEPYGVMHCYCNIQECVTGKFVTVPDLITIHYSIRSMDRY